jgi:hypothetical protein
VSFLDSRAIHAVIERQGGRAESDATWTRDWNAVNAVDQGVFEVEKGIFQFPLSREELYLYRVQ